MVVRTVRGRFGYALNVLIDTPGGVALDVEATPARFAVEVDAGRDMLARAAERFGYRPKRIAADTAYGSAAFLAFLRDRGAIPHIPVMERSEQATGKFSRADFTYDRERDRYTCPAGKELGHGGFDHRTEAHIYAARASDCQPCPLRSQCTRGRLRRVTHSADKDARDLARAEMQTGLYKRSMRLRRGVERVFADAKAKRGLVRLHLRGIRGAEEEFQVVAAVSNLLLLARPAKRAPRPGRARAVHRRVSDMERVSRNRSAVPAMQGVAELLSSATPA
jgi:Transposase DDE domain